MTWTQIHDRGGKIGRALFYIALGALLNGIYLQSAKIDFWRQRSTELYAVQPAPGPKSKPAAQTPPRCPETGYRGEPVHH